MTIRVEHISAVVFEHSKRGHFFRILIAFLVVAILILYVSSKVKIVRLGYQIETLEREKQELERENRSLLIEASSLMSPARLEQIAVRQLGMLRPLKENIVIVKRNKSIQKKQ